MYSASLRRLSALAVVAGLAGLTGPVQAQYTWINPAGGNWSVASNWTGGVPASGASTTLTFSPGTYTSTDDLSPTPFQLTGLTFGASGTATVSDMGQGLDFVGATPTITMGAGNGTITSAVTLGANTSINGGAGTLTFSGAVSDGSVGGTPAFFLTKNSTGSLVLAGGGTVTQLLLNSGTTNITGGTFNVTQFDSGAREPAIGIGETAGTASLTINGGATVNVGDNIFVGDVAGSTGTLTVSGAGTVVNHTNPNAGTLGVGRLAVGNFGSGTLNILNGAVVNTSYLFTPREPGTNTGTIVVDGPGSTLNVNAEISFCSNGFGSATFSHGAQLGGGGDMLLGVNATGNGFVTFTDPGTTANITQLLVAYSVGSSNCTVNILNGATFNATQSAFIGEGGASSGTVNVFGAGASLLVPGFDQNLVVGDAGNGTLNISSGGTVKAGLLFTAVGVGTTGTINVSGFGSTFAVVGQTTIAGNFDATGTPVPGGTSVINGNDGAVVNFGQTFLFGGGTLNVNTGFFGSFTVGGLFDGQTGTSVGTVAVGSGSTFTIDTAGSNASFSGIISGAGGVTKTGLGTQFFTGGVNTFTGPLGLNGGVLNFGTAADLGAGTDIIFDGGTLQWGAANTTDISSRTVTISPGGATIDTGANNVTLASAIGNGGSGQLTKLGTGTLTLGGANTYSGGTNVQNGVVSVSSDANLGTGNVSGSSLGTVLFTGSTTTTKSFAMAGGMVSVAAAQTLTLTGSVISSTVLNGSGTFATDATAGAQFVASSSTPSVTIASNSANDQFVNFTNGGKLTVAGGLNTSTALTPINFNGFNNQGGGSITIGANSRLNLSNFQTSGTLTLLPATAGQTPPQHTLITNVGTSPLFFNGGSRTFIGTPATASGFVAGVDLHGQNGIVAGGLFVNNGFVVDTAPAGTATIVADFGALVKGAGFFQNTVITQNGGKFQAGNSPGVAQFGNFTFGPGGVNNYVFAIDDATGTAGPSPNGSGQVSGWGLVKAVGQTIGTMTTSGNFSWTASPQQKVAVSLDTLVNPTTVGVDVPGAMADFDPNQSYTWLAAQWSGSYSGPTSVAALDASTAFDTSGFVNPVAGSFGWYFNSSDHSLSLTYTPSPVPEPGTLVLVGAAAAAGLWRRRKVAAK